MKKIVKRILSFILTAVMVFALLPVIGNPMVVKAEDTPAEHVAHDEQCSAEETDCEYHKGWKSISDAASLMSIGEKDGYWYLTDNINITEALEIKSGITVHLCLNGFSITQTADKTDTITVEGTLNLYDKKDNLGIITHASEKNGSGVKIKYNGSFTMNGGTISGNNADYGGGVYNLGTFTMNGGTISGNKKEAGGGVYNSGTFTMEGGIISGNEGKVGGGVYNYGTFTMNGGIISGNEADYGGGVTNARTFIMKEGKILGNTAKYTCGGVINSGAFTMEGGIISGNKANNSSGGVGTLFDGTFTMEGGYLGDNVEGSSVSSYTVTYNPNGGLGQAFSQIAPANQNVKLIPNEYELYGKAFEGWNTEPDGSGESYKDNATINRSDNLIIYCQWKDLAIISHDITFKVNNGTWSDGTKDEKKVTVWRYENEEKTLNLEVKDIPLINSVTGYKGSWDTEPDTENALTGNKTYTYTFAPIEYTVKYDSNGGVGTMDNQSRAYDDKKPLTTNAFTLEGYTFNGWNTAADGSGTSYADENVSNLSNTDGDTVTLFAQWQANNYTVIFDANGGDGRMEDQGRTYDDKAPLTTNTFTFEGKTFNGWNTASDGSGTHFKDEEVNNLSSTEGDTVTLYAQWTTNTYTVSWKDYDGTVLETDTDVAYGSTPSYDGETPIKEKEGNKEYTFSGWTPAVDTVKGAATYTATYSEKETVEPTEPNEPEEPATPKEPQEPKEPTEPEDPQEPIEPEVPEITEPEPEVEIPEKDWLDDLRLALNIAAEPDSEKTVEYSGDFALPYEIMNFFVNHPDITFVYHVTYEGQEYTITIPAGKAVAYADTPWYGPLWLLANYGGNNAPTGAKGNGTYVVKAGDTLTGISVRLGVTIQYLVDKNGIKNPDYIVEGQELIY